MLICMPILFLLSSRKGTVCEQHMLLLFKKEKEHRQEFASK
jgi:hypothetical protein